MKKAFFLLVLFVAVSAVTFGQTQQNNNRVINITDIEPYQEAPKQVNDKAAVSSSNTGNSINLATKTGDSAPGTKSSAKRCCSMKGEKHDDCSSMSKADYKKCKKKKSKASSAL